MDKGTATHRPRKVQNHGQEGAMEAYTIGKCRQDNQAQGEHGRQSKPKGIGSAKQKRKGKTRGSKDKTAKRKTHKSRNSDKTREVWSSRDNTDRVHNKHPISKEEEQIPENTMGRNRQQEDPQTSQDGEEPQEANRPQWEKGPQQN